MSERAAPLDADKRINAATMPDFTAKSKIAPDTKAPKTSDTRRWFRFYSEALDDPKVQRLPPHLFKSWINLLCLAAPAGGDLPSIDDIAFRLRISAQDARAQIDELILIGLIDLGPSGKMTPHNWSTRQARSDVSRERTRRYRQRKINPSTNSEGDGSVTGNVTSHVTGCDAECDALDSDSEEIRLELPLPSEQEAKPDSAGFENRLGLGLGESEGAHFKAISPRSKLRVARDLGIADTEPIVAAFVDWQLGKPPAQRARQADALFVASAAKIFRNLTDAERARCGPATDDPSDIKPRDVTASPQLAALLAKGGNHGC